MFNESNSVEDFIRDTLTQKRLNARILHEQSEQAYNAASATLDVAGLGWRYIPAEDLPRDKGQVLVEAFLVDALQRLNPQIASRPDRADEVIYKLRAILMAARSGGLVGANEAFSEWLRGEKSMPFGRHNEHVSVRLIDFDNLGNNDYVVTTQYRIQATPTIERRLDIVLLVNGIPLVVGEVKTPTRPAISWVDGAAQIHDDYEVNVPAVFVPNVFSFATEGKEYRYGSIRRHPAELHPLRHGQEAPAHQDHLPLPAVRDANQIVARVVAGYPKKGLIWHFQGSGKSLLMVFAAQKLRMHPEAGQSHGDDRGGPHRPRHPDHRHLQRRRRAEHGRRGHRQEAADAAGNQDVRKVLITTIHKFGEAAGS
jgi:type I restriction enzyme, R subunit